jgi:hypothetical protein
MPIKPGPTESKEEFISRCIGEEITAGYEQSQAAAICYSKWDRKEMSSKKYSDPQKRVMSKLNFEKKYEGINLQEPAEGLEDACWEGYVAIGLKPMDGRMVPNCVPVEEEMEKIFVEKGINLQEEGVSYPWEECIADQTARYGDEEIAKKVCGMIKSKYGS